MSMAEPLAISLCPAASLHSSDFGGSVSDCLQAQEARMREQEAEKQERARLEEILTMCAEYERQAQCERQQSKPPSTPTLQQNR